MSAKLEPTIGEIPEIKPEERVMKLRCVGKGEALWARFDLMYPIIITARKYLGHLANGAAQNVEVMAVKVNGQMNAGLPSHVDAGRLDIIVQAKGSTSIEIELIARIEPETVGVAASASQVADAIAALEDEVNAERDAQKGGNPEDPAPRPPPVDPRGLDALLPTAPLQVASNEDGVFPLDCPPEVAAQATLSLSALLKAKDMDDATRLSVQAFVDADGDPSETLRKDAAKSKRARVRETEPV